MTEMIISLPIKSIVLSDNINQGLKNSRHNYHTKTTVSQIKHPIFHAHYLDEK